ncbi:hypothetical protein DVH24_005989 [Malus domestica]|uniref:Uncharacterized protein n=1 Tax=Malus domestica TaxID=3750 RepID=A0A498IK52_MALDO|nr:hypothetical protein DVH24_005989 [Malus domestica]
MLKLAQSDDPVHRGAAIAQQHSIVVSSCGVVIKQNCPMQWEKWAEIPDRTKDLVRDKLSYLILLHLRLSSHFTLLIPSSHFTKKITCNIYNTFPYIYTYIL